MHVLRVRTGDEVTLFNGRGGEFAARIASIERLKVLVDVLEHRAIERESPLRIVLVQGVSSGERMDFTVRKSVELGVAEIHPVLAASSVARPKGERAAARHAHWQKIAIAACEQCGRNHIPHRACRWWRRPTTVAARGRGSCCRRRSELRFSQACKSGGQSFTIAAGPEAGFNAEEEARIPRCRLRAGAARSARAAHRDRRPRGARRA